MVRMVIADDERLIRESLHKLMDWNSIGVEVVGVAADGSAALNMVRELSPQILLADISMPEMDGIETIAKIRELGLNCHVIFLSAHSKFSYAQNAVKYSAFDYILKPIDEDELMGTVIRCIEAIKREKRDHPPGGKDRTHTMMLNNALCALLCSNRTPTRHDIDILTPAGIEMDGEDLCVGALLPAAAGGDADFSFPVQTKLETVTVQKTVLISDSDRLLLWIGRGLGPEELFQEFCSFLREQDGGLRDIYISDPHPLSEIQRVYAECSFARLFPYLDGEISSHSFRGGAAILGETYPHVYAEEVLKAIQQQDMTSVRRLQNRMFWRFAQKGQIYDLDLIKLKCITLLDGLKEALPFVDEAAKSLENDMMTEAKKRVNIQQSLGDVYAELLEALLRFSGYFKAIESLGGSWLVAQAAEYIRENYATASLTDVSQKLHVSTTYLSCIFAKEMNITFSKYLQKHRMRMAKKLLREPEYKIYNVATMVGYSDIAHFSKAFKQSEGISPTKYRNTVMPNR